MGKIKKSIKAKNDIVKYINCLCANISFVSLIRWYDKNTNGITNKISKKSKWDIILLSNKCIMKE